MKMTIQAFALPNVPEGSFRFLLCAPVAARAARILSMASRRSYSEPALCSENEMVRDIVLAVMSSLAKVERARISERTKAGLARVRAKGTRLGRPALADTVQAKIAALASSSPRMNAYAISKAVGCDVKTAAKYRR